MISTKRILLLALAWIVTAPAAQATVFNFDMVYDGANLNLEAGSDTPAGTSLSAGDSFVADIQAIGDGFWEVENNYGPQILPLTFFVLDGADRVGTANTGFFLDGVEVHRINEGTVNQSSVHIGAQDWSLVAGLIFDQVVLDFSLVSSTAANTIIQPTANIFDSFGLADSPFVNSSDISFKVPAPGTLGLLVVGMLLGATRRNFS